MVTRPYKLGDAVVELGENDSIQIDLNGTLIGYSFKKGESFDNVDNRLKRIIHEAFQHGLEITVKGSILNPFIMTRGKQEIRWKQEITDFAMVRHTLKTYSESSPDVAVSKAKQDCALLTNEIELCAIGWVGELTLESKKYNSLFVEAYARGMDNSIIYAQPYLPKKFLRSLKCVGDPINYGKGQPLLEQS